MAKVFTIADGLENLGALRTGGQGSVYKAKRGELITAVKILPTPIHSEDENDKNFRDFQNEVSKLKKVNEEPNPNVVKILSSGITESGSLPFIEMEYIEGPDLEDLLKPPLDTVFSIQETVKVAEQLSHALAHCHKVSVKHGDIKSNNVKFNIHTGNYMLLDFGLAIMSDEQRRTSLRRAGAIEFMSPEQHEGELLFESDVYSFGIILYELIAGVVPFPLQGKGESARNAIMVSHMENPVPDILEQRKKNMPASWEEGRKDFEMLVPGWLLDIIAKCLEKRPENRFGDGTELHNTIVKRNELHTGTYAYDDSESAVLRRENARLKAVLLQYQQNENKVIAPALIIKEKEAFIKVSPFGKREKKAAPGWLDTSALGALKPVLMGVGILILVLGLFAGYSAFNNPEIEASDSTAFYVEKQRLSDSIANVQRFNDSIAGSKRLAASQPSKWSEEPERNDSKQYKKQREREKKEYEKRREREKKDAEQIREELKRQFEGLLEGRDD